MTGSATWKRKRKRKREEINAEGTEETWRARRVGRQDTGIEERSFAALRMTWFFGVERY
jgi:hypothetical protein